MSPNLYSCIRTGVHWIWEQFSFKRITLARNILLLIFLKVTTLWRPITRHTRKKRWWRCELLPISGHISMVNALLWWLIIYLYGGSWTRISLLASSLRGLYCSRNMTLRWYTVPILPTWMQMDSPTNQVLHIKNWSEPCGMGIVIERRFQVGTQQPTLLCFLALLLRFRYKAWMMRLINLKLLQIYGRIFPYCISFRKGPFSCLFWWWKGIGLDIK